MRLSRKRARALALGATLTLLASPAASAAQGAMTRPQAAQTRSELTFIYEKLAKQFDLRSLSATHADTIEFELRVYGAVGVEQLPALVLRSEGGALRAYRLRKRAGDSAPAFERTLLRGDWRARWRQLDSIGLLALPPQGADPSTGADVPTAFIELRAGKEYRNWTYSRAYMEESKWLNDSSTDGRMKRILTLVVGWVNAELE